MPWKLCNKVTCVTGCDGSKALPKEAGEPIHSPPMTQKNRSNEQFQPPVWLRNPHLQTVWPTLFRRIDFVPDATERLETPDDDFLDLDWYQRGNGRLLVLSHGLEGYSRRPYMLGMVQAALASGWDVLAWNFRSCSGEMNRQPCFYHSGSSDDLSLVVERALAESPAYDSIVLGGFSMGGNVTLVYLGERGASLDPRIRGAAVFSVPCDLAGSARELARPANRFYMSRFMDELRVKVRAKHELYPDLIPLEGLDRMKTFAEYDDQYTAPLHGFRDAEDYWYRCSSTRFLGGIRVPALIVNAADDPFLSPGSYPHAEVMDNRRVRLEVPPYGGHVGFVGDERNGYYWSEWRAMRFLESLD